MVRIKSSDIIFCLYRTIHNSYPAKQDIFPRYGPIFKIAIFGHETWPLAKVPEVAQTHVPPVLSFYPRGAKLSLFSLYGQRFPRYGPIFKFAIFGHETWPSAKVPEVSHIASFYPWGAKLSYFRSTGSGFRDSGRFSKLPHLGMKIGHWLKFQKLHIYSLSTPWGQNWAYIFALRATVSEIQADFQNCHIWAWNLPIGQSSRSCTYTIFVPQGGQNWAHFPSTGSGFRDTGRFSELPYLGNETGVAHIVSFSQGVEIELILALRAAISKIRVNFQNCHIWAWNLAIGQVPEIAHILHKTTPESQISLHFALRLPISKILAIFHFPLATLSNFNLFKLKISKFL